MTDHYAPKAAKQGESLDDALRLDAEYPSLESLVQAEETS